MSSAKLQVSQQTILSFLKSGGLKPTLRLLEQNYPMSSAKLQVNQQTILSFLRSGGLKPTLRLK